MQTLFAKNRDSELSQTMAMRSFEKSLDTSFIEYLIHMYVLLGVCRYAVKDADRRLSKHIKTEKDEKFSDKLFSNGCVQSIKDHPRLNQHFKDKMLEAKIDKDVIRKLYKEFAATNEYQDYVYNPDTTSTDHIEILHELYRSMRKNELFNEMMEDFYATWHDDKSLVIGAVKKSLKALPISNDHLDMFTIPEETSDFGIKLLNRTMQEDEDLLKIFEPTLKNWDSERLAILDMILLKMAICEFLYFKTIPTKVTLNEYVEIAKTYSTSKSKDFINGILDKVMRQLSDSGKIVKEGRGLTD